MIEVGDFTQQDYFAPKGWVCPKCGRVYAPSTPMCWYCSGNNNTITNVGTTKPVDWDTYLRPVTLNSDTFQIHPDSITYSTGEPIIQIKYNPNTENVWFIN